MKKRGAVLKRFFLCVFAFLLCLTVAACAQNRPRESASESGSSADTSPQESSFVPPPKHIFTGTERFDNRTLQNGDNKMSDADGPAYCVYSKKGFQGACMDLQLSDIELNIFKPDGTHVNAYLFLGADVYDASGNWVNCADAGLCYSGTDGWHVFYNLYSVADPANTNTWYESKRRLPADCDYRLTFDCAKREGYATLTVFNLTEGKLADRISFELQYAETDGSNTAFLTNFALDYPEELRKDPSGNPSDDWAQVTLYNTDQGIYMRNIGVYNAALIQNGTQIPWTTETTQNRGIWPDASVSEIDYPCTSVHHADGDTAYIVDLDMNRKR